jgi:hypothetical protein
LPPEFEGDALELSACDRTHLTADASRTGEADHVDEGLFDQCCARLRSSRQNVEQSIRQVSCFEQLCEGHVAGHRRLHIGFQDHGVAHCEGWADRPRA